MKINVGDTKQRKSTVRKNDEGFKKNHYFYIFSFLAATEYIVFFCYTLDHIYVVRYEQTVRQLCF